MASKGNKFGAFKGVFTPSVLTILGVIMYLRLPWIVGQAGLWSALGIVLVAHLISVTTGLSVASIATDKRVETGGSYYIISRSLGLPIGGTLGLALFIGLSFSVSLYIIGFSETLLSAFGFEVTLRNIRIAGTATLMLITIITFVSTNLALKTQFLILLIMALSLMSIFLGRHEWNAEAVPAGEVGNTLPWIALFAIFFPAVTGFEAGVSMSGDLKDPKKSIPGGTILAIVTGLAVYLALVLFLHFTVSREALLRDPNILPKISLFAPLVIAGVWGATLSSALGSILGAPRILQAMAMDRIGLRFFARGTGAGNEPRNALLLTFVIALAGIMIGELNLIARVVSIFFIMSYGFLNLTCALENWAGSDFRPAFRIPTWVSLTGAAACFIVMIQLDFIAMIGATLVLGTLFLLLKRMELRLQSGDTWLGFWASLVKYGLLKLTMTPSGAERHWRPNIILFGGDVQERPHLIDMGRTLVGKMGVFTNFNLSEEPGLKRTIPRPVKTQVTTDTSGKKVITRHHVCADINEGMELIGNIYGFPGFEPNTILMGWTHQSMADEKYHRAMQRLADNDYNLIFLDHKARPADNVRPQIDFWWSGNSRNLRFGLAILKFITTDPSWRGLPLRILVINYRGTRTESIYAYLQEAIAQARLIGTVKVINNSVENLPEHAIIRNESAASALTLLEPEPQLASKTVSWMPALHSFIDELGTVLILHSGSGFEISSIDNQPEPVLKKEQTGDRPAPSIVSSLKWPEDAFLAGELRKIAHGQEELLGRLLEEGYGAACAHFLEFHSEIRQYSGRIRTQAEKAILEKDAPDRLRMLMKSQAEFSFKIRQRLEEFRDKLLTAAREDLQASLRAFRKHQAEALGRIPDKLIVQHEKAYYRQTEGDSWRVRFFKFRKRLFGTVSKRALQRGVKLRNSAELLLIRNRIAHLEASAGQFGLATLSFVNTLRRSLAELGVQLDQAIRQSGDPAQVRAALDRFDGVLAGPFREAGSGLSASMDKIAGGLRADLASNLELLGAIAGAPEAAFRILPFRKSLKRRSPEHLETIPEIWHHNLRLFSNKSYAEFLIIALQHRIWTKLHREVGDISLIAENRLNKPIRSAVAILEQFGNAPEYSGVRHLGELAREVKPGGFMEDFSPLLRELRDILEELPETIEINDDRFFTDLEQGRFAESDVRVIEFRKQAEFYIGTGLISPAATETEATSAKLDEIATRVRDSLRLAVFNLENLLIEAGDPEPANRNEKSGELVAGIVRELEYQKEQVSKCLTSFEAKLTGHLHDSIEPLQELIFATAATGRVGVRARREKNAPLHSMLNRYGQFTAFLRRQSVKLLYTQSKGLILAQRLSAFESEHKISNQAIQEMLVCLAADREVLRGIPFYYQSLFSGRSAISEDLWIGRRRELEAAERIVSRHIGGYPGALLITGPRNSGKTSLSRLIALKYLPKHPLHVVQPPRGGSVRMDDLKQSMRKSLGTDLEPARFLLDSEQRHVVIFNDLELWWERHPDGMQVVQEIVASMQQLQHKCFFIVNCGDYAYQMIDRIMRIEASFMGHLTCSPCDARELKEIVMSRHRMGGLQLVLQGKREEELTEWHYARLFNRYFRLSGGNPGYTLQAWLANIVKLSGNTAYIRPPEIPDARHLGNMSEDLLVVLLQLVLHRRCTVSRLASALRQSEESTSGFMAEMHKNSLVEERFPGVFAINSYLEPFLVQVLEEKGLLPGAAAKHEPYHT
jgi:amino acid transporter